MQAIDDNETASKNPQSEDCLTLNIWTRCEGKNKPVIVFIHGGAFSFESASDPLYTGTHIAAAHDIVLVTINYRLNVFGFVNFGAIDSSFEDTGYLGIKDQIAALMWVKKNISEFGGNPNNITIFGESAGSISIFLLSVAPAAKNLFQKAIPQSANSYMYNTPETSTPVAETYMKLGGAKNMGDMMKKSAVELVGLYEKVEEVRGVETNRDYLPTCNGKLLPLKIRSMRSKMATLAELSF